MISETERVSKEPGPVQVVLDDETDRTTPEPSAVLLQVEVDAVQELLAGNGERAGQR